MIATEIKEGRYYAASSYGQPRLSTSLKKVRVLARLPTRKGHQKRYTVEVVGGLNHAWGEVEKKTHLRARLKSGNFFAPWGEVLDQVRDRQERAKKREEERKKQKEEGKREEKRRESMIREVAKLTGVELYDLDNLDFNTNRNETRSHANIPWDKIEALLTSLKAQKAIMQEATQGAMELLDDVF